MDVYNEFDIKIIEGEYINGLRNGKGKEFYNNGEYINGLRNGKGKKYDKNGKIIVDGEYSNDYGWNVKNMIKIII